MEGTPRLGRYVRLVIVGVALGMSGCSACYLEQYARPRDPRVVGYRSLLCSYDKYYIPKAYEQKQSQQDESKFAAQDIESSDKTK